MDHVRLIIYIIPMQFLRPFFILYHFFFKLTHDIIDILLKVLLKTLNLNDRITVGIIQENPYLNIIRITDLEKLGKKEYKHCSNIFTNI